MALLRKDVVVPSLMVRAPFLASAARSSGLTSDSVISVAKMAGVAKRRKIMNLYIVTVMRYWVKWKIQDWIHD